MTRTHATDPTAGVVVCGVDSTEGALHVIAAAKAIAGRAGAPLLLAHVVRSSWESQVPAFRLDAGTPRVVTHGPAGPRLLAVADSRGAGLIVVGSRVLGRVRRRFHPSVSRYVARRASCPVMIVPAGADPEAPRTGSHVVCVLEGAADGRVLSHAMELACRLTARLVAVVDASGSDGDAVRGLLAQVDPDGVEVETRAVSGDSGPAVTAASEGAAAVVARAPGRWQRGSALARSATVPLVLVPRGSGSASAAEPDPQAREGVYAA